MVLVLPTAFSVRLKRRKDIKKKGIEGDITGDVTRRRGTMYGGIILEMKLRPNPSNVLPNKAAETCGCA